MVAHVAAEDDAALFLEYARTRDAQLRERLITRYVGLVSFLARRFGASNEQLDDLIQVGFIGLIKAIDRFEPQRGVAEDARVLKNRAQKGPGGELGDCHAGQRARLGPDRLQ